MTELEMKVEALRRCVSQQAYEKALKAIQDGDVSAEPVDLHELVQQVLLDLAIPAHLIGYSYLACGIEAVVENPETIRNMTAKVYPSIAKEFGTTPKRVERGMRHAIEVGWSRGDLDVQHQYFGYTVSPNKGKPTNSEFLAQVAANIRRRTQPHT